MLSGNPQWSHNKIYPQLAFLSASSHHLAGNPVQLTYTSTSPGTTSLAGRAWRSMSEETKVSTFPANHVTTAENCMLKADLSKGSQAIHCISQPRWWTQRLLIITTTTTATILLSGPLVMGRHNCSTLSNALSLLRLPHAHSSQIYLFFRYIHKTFSFLSLSPFEKWSWWEIETFKSAIHIVCLLFFYPRANYGKSSHKRLERERWMLWNISVSEVHWIL